MSARAGCGKAANSNPTDSAAAAVKARYVILALDLA